MHLHRVAQPLFIRELVRSFSEHSDVSEGGQYGLACGVIVSTFMITMFFHPSFHGGSMIIQYTYILYF